MKPAAYRIPALVSVGVLFLALLFAGPAMAQQSDLQKTYVAPDGSYSFAYPLTWQLQTSRGLVYLSGNGLTISVVGPNRLTRFRQGNTGEPLAVLNALTRQIGITGGVPLGLVVNERPAARLDAPNPAGYPGFLMVTTLRNGRLVALDVRYTDPQRTPDEASVLALIGSLDVPTGLPPERLNAPLDSPLIIVAELVAAGVIPSGTLPIFDVPRTFREGYDDAVFVSLAADRPAQDIVMGGTLSFTAGDPEALEICSLGARIVSGTDALIDEYLEVGFTSAGEIFYGDYAADGIRSRTSFRRITGNTHYVTLIALGDTLTVYLDGERIFDRVPVSARTGTYGVGLISGEARARCEGREVWGFAIPAVTSGVCLAQSDVSVNRRAGPGMEYAALSHLVPGETAQVLARSTDAQGATWWLLADGTFVSASVVTVEGYCAGLPFRR